MYLITAGYEDCNDADMLRRRDPAFKASCDRLLDDPDLASQPTLSRLENSVTAADLYRIAEYFLSLYLRRTRNRKPKRIILDIDATDDPTHGNQQLTFFHGFYDQHMYHPLLMYDADSGDLVTAVLRPGNKHASHGLVSILQRVIPRIRQALPNVQLIIRADAGMAIPALYEYCEQEGLDYIVGLIRNDVLERLAEGPLQEAHRRYELTDQKQRLFADATYQAQSWPHARRAIIKAEWLHKGANRRFVVTNLPGSPEHLYDFYTERGGTCEVRIDELKNGLKADRLSCHRFIANQFRLFLHMAAYYLVQRFREALAKTAFATMHIQQLRLRVLKIGAQVLQSARRLWFRLAGGYPWKEIFTRAHERLLLDSC